MLSSRGKVSADQLDIPWKFALGTTYDPDTNPEGLISFATAENALMQQELEDFANKVHITAAAFTYRYSTAAGGTKFPAALAGLFNEYFNPYQAVPANDIKITAAATALHEILAFSLADPNDGILLSRPYYGRFELDFGNKAQVKVISPNTYAETCFRPDVVDAYEDAIEQARKDGVRVRALLIVNPHNPLGRCYPRETLIALMSLCQKHRIHFISDEVYALSVFDSGESNTVPFTSVLSIDPAGILDSDLIHVTYAMSKDFGSAGLRLGALVTKNEQLKKALLAVIRFHSSAGPSIAIGTAMLEDRTWCQSFITTSRQRIALAYKFVTGRLIEMGVKYLPGGNAGFFVWIDLSPYLGRDTDGLPKDEREQIFAKKLVDAGVFLQPDEEHALVVGWYRMVFTMERRVVEEGLRRLESVLNATNHSTKR